MSTEIDARGLKCPQPVIATKKALEALERGTLTTIVDNVVAKENVVKFAVASQCGASVEERDGHYYIRISKDRQAEAVVQPAQGTVLLVGSDTLGRGSEELGEVLMKAFFYSLLEAPVPPRSILFINSGIKLTTEGSPVLEHILTLADRGVEILSCGTCLDYFSLKEKLAVGGVTNMYTILDQLSTAPKVITL